MKSFMKISLSAVNSPGNTGHYGCEEVLLKRLLNGVSNFLAEQRLELEGLLNFVLVSNFVAVCSTFLDFKLMLCN
ncbi:hypothetical protein RIF29_38768 [Crotalaria pallida]|uniref:Uncharacterized protein n=1 Tax=Crotalaria pallida TaxID=3830 RepID=A0AAN9E2Z0_CROPI